jgi:hypothetical protein
MKGVKREKRPLGMVAPSRTTEIGGTRVARSAGNSPARSVTTMPTISETTTVRVAKTRPVCGSARSSASKSAFNPLARR